MIDFNLVHRIIICLDSYRNALEKIDTYIYSKKYLEILLREIKVKYGHTPEWQKYSIQKRYENLSEKIANENNLKFSRYY